MRLVWLLKEMNITVVSLLGLFRIRFHILAQTPPLLHDIIPALSQLVFFW